MKKTLLTISVNFVVAVMFAQTAVPISNKAIVPASVAKQTLTIKSPGLRNTINEDVFPGVQTTGAAVKKTHQPVSVMGNQVNYIGLTNYQLQSNASNRDALVKSSDGSVSAVWTMLYTGQNATLRGTGYNHSANGLTWGTNPTTRIESQRTGWPSIGITSTNKEIFVTHNTDVSELQLTSRAAKGTGAWTQNTTALASPSLEGNVWPRLATGGSDGQTIHVISLTAPTGLGGAIYNKQNGCLTYCRSIDNGATWDKLHYVNALHDSAAGYTYISGDEYAIDAKGTTVAYLVGTPTTNLILVKSTDNGNTWNKTVVRSFPIPFFFDQITDINNDSQVDTFRVNDGNFALVLDNSGNAHVFYGTYTMFNAVTTDSTYSYFPYDSDLRYWNESMPTDSTKIAGSLVDLNGNSTYDVPTGQNSSGSYNCGAVSHPSAGVDANGNIFVVFDEVADGADDGQPTPKAFRNVFVSASKDGGLTWPGIIRALPDDGQEQVYPSAAKFVNNCFSFIFQQDGAAGHGVSGAGPANPDAALNSNIDADIVYNCLDVSDVLSVHEKLNTVFSVSDNYPNPFNDFTTIGLSVNKASVISVDVYNSIGEKVQVVPAKNYGAGNHNINIQKGSLSSGLYFITIRSSEFSVSKQMVIE